MTQLTGPICFSEQPVCRNLPALGNIPVRSTGNNGKAGSSRTQSYVSSTARMWSDQHCQAPAQNLVGLPITGRTKSKSSLPPPPMCPGMQAAPSCLRFHAPTVSPEGPRASLPHILSLTFVPELLSSAARPRASSAHLKFNSCCSFPATLTPSQV